LVALSGLHRLKGDRRVNINLTAMMLGEHMAKTMR